MTTVRRDSRSGVAAPLDGCVAVIGLTVCRAGSFSRKRLGSTGDNTPAIANMTANRRLYGRIFRRTYRVNAGQLERGMRASLTARPMSSSFAY
jgi:hypothetical protein